LGRLTCILCSQANVWAFFLSPEMHSVQAVKHKDAPRRLKINENQWRQFKLMKMY
jgi:Rps23 Pro-64 3,4-dihydroxylase Tpa1-like proline 4-hydroxylase